MHSAGMTAQMHFTAVTERPMASARDGDIAEKYVGMDINSLNFIVL